MVVTLQNLSGIPKPRQVSRGEAATHMNEQCVGEPDGALLNDLTLLGQGEKGGGGATEAPDHSPTADFASSLTAYALLMALMARAFRSGTKLEASNNTRSPPLSSHVPSRVLGQGGGGRFFRKGWGGGAVGGGPPPPGTPSC